MLLAAVLAVLSLLSAAGASRCPPASQERGTYTSVVEDKCLQFVFSEKTWVNAKQFCYDRGAALASAETRSKYNKIVGLLEGKFDVSGKFGGRQGFWLGLHDRRWEGTFLWDEGRGNADSRMSWSNWNPGEPNDLTGQDCVYMRRSYGFKWVDVGCGDGFHVNRFYSFACEHEIDTTVEEETTLYEFPNRSDSNNLNAGGQGQGSAVSTTDRTSLDAVDKAGVGRVASNTASQGDGQKTTSVSVTVSLIVVIAVLVLIIILLVVYRRRRKLRADSGNSLSNPSYDDDVPGKINDLGSGKGHEYAVCRKESNGNFYMEFEVSEDPADDSKVAFSNKNYMKPPTFLPPNIGAEDAENEANIMKAHDFRKAAHQSKYLDECGMYTEDGYMAPKHLYASIGETALPPPPYSPPHYDVLNGAKKLQAPCPDSSAGMYEDMDAMKLDSKSSPSYSNIPAKVVADHYDVPTNGASAVESRSEPEKAETVATETVLYDVPKLQLKVAAESEEVDV